MAAAAHELGAETVLVSGSVAIEPPAGVRVVHVESAEDMLQAMLAEYDDANIVVKTAAVADYRPKTAHVQKMKKQPGDAIIELERTTDILLTLGKLKKDQLLIGFAAETNDVLKYAKGKLEKKNANYIVANDVTQDGAGFGTDTNTVTLVGHNDFEKTFVHLPKKELALELFKTILAREARLS
jgi:phosphopantothenoylcysteine decarboxylase/phosphopantothenate--cysteine ligase